MDQSPTFNINQSPPVDIATGRFVFTTVQWRLDEERATRDDVSTVISICGVLGGITDETEAAADGGVS